jgi:enolase-phosphatase E1
MILVDIEGTTTDIGFVHDVLFPLSYEALPAFVAAHPDDPDVLAAKARVGDGDLVETLRKWIREDRKETVLKQLQGRIWAASYADGTLKSHVYDDVAPAFARWKAAGKPIYVYSSGSVEAQRLLFGHTTAGDLTSFLSGYFDTTTGPKRDPASYSAIARAIGVEPSTILFLSDVEAELDAAAIGGMGTVQLLRPGHPTPSTRHTTAPSLDDIA